MFCDAHRTQQHSKQVYHVQSTVSDNRSIARSKNHHYQKIQVAKHREKLQNGEQSTGIHCQQFPVQKQRTDPTIIQIQVRPHLEHVQCNSGPHI